MTDLTPHGPAGNRVHGDGTDGHQAQPLDVELLMSLLPAYLRVRDEEVGIRIRNEHPDVRGRSAAEFGPLRSLLAAIAEEMARVDDSIDALYDDMFIETCADWVVPYLGELVGARLPPTALAARLDVRSLVAETVALRRRKGTILGLERVVNAALHPWTALATESFRGLARTQRLDHPSTGTGSYDIRSPLAGEDAHGPFAQAAHSVDVRTAADGGVDNIPIVPIWLWRLAAARRRRSRPVRVSVRRFRFDPLDRDIALWRRPVALLPEERVQRHHVAEPWTRHRAARELQWEVDIDIEIGPDSTSIPPVDGMGDELVRICDLSDRPGMPGRWNHDADGPVTRIDPVLGRFVLGTIMDPGDGIRVTYHVGSPRLFGGGDIERAGIERVPTLSVSAGSTLADRLVDIAAYPHGGTVRIDDSLDHELPPQISVPDGAVMVIRAANGEQPMLRHPDAVEIRLGVGATLVLDGVWVAAAALTVVTSTNFEAAGLHIVDSTIGPLCTTIIASPAIAVAVDRSVIGPVRLDRDAALDLQGSVVVGAALQAMAVGGVAGTPGGRMDTRASTILGQVHLNEIGLISDTIIAARPADGPSVHIARRQVGCVRHSAVPPDAVTPRRYRCTSDAPVFVSTDHADAHFGVLDARTPTTISAGAADGSEMGVFGVWQSPARRALLDDRLTEFLRFGMNAGAHHIT